jgi:hypothetical protein
MYGIRWLPVMLVMLVVLAACVAAPEAQAQTWLRWSKTSAVKDPAKQVPPPRRQALVPPTVVPPAMASAQPKLTPVPVKVLQTERSEAALPTTVPTPRGPTVTIIEDRIVEAGSQPAPVVASIPSPPPLVSAPAATAAPRSPPIPVFDPMPQPASATPAQIDDAAIQAAPLAMAAEVAAAPPSACSDCPTQDELQAISAAPGNGDMPPEDRQIQSEIKQRLLQGH